ncbi:hypothetical protein HMPREF1556_01337 [Porphyromonas sp. oral taxon 278 str. W7784]|nr:hypothetical protein HMPREF1556_01337 [Porphyromonas sp. oral taxon 278 str. W7784]
MPSLENAPFLLVDPPRFWGAQTTPEEALERQCLDLGSCG